MSALQSLPNCAVEQAEPERNPCERLKPLKAVNVTNRAALAATPEEEARLHWVMKDRSDHLRPMYLLAVNTGLRRGELFQLRWEDIREDTIHLTRSKGGRDRFVPLNTAAWAAMDAWGNRGEGLVFPGPKGQPMSHVKRSWSSLQSAAGITKSWHQCPRRVLLDQIAGRLVATLPTEPTAVGIETMDNEAANLCAEHEIFVRKVAEWFQEVASGADPSTVLLGPPNRQALKGAYRDSIVQEVAALVAQGSSQKSAH